MSKKFDEEYQEYIKQDLPDLWSRIENGISEQTKASEKALQKKRLAKKQMFAFATTLAACICLFVIAVPIYKIVNNSKQMETAMSSDMEVENVEEEAMSEETSMSDQAMLTDSSAEEMAPAEDSATLENASNEDSYNEATSSEAETSEATTTEDTTNAGTENSSSDKINNVSETTESGVAKTNVISYQNVIVTIVSVENTGEEKIFKATVVSDASKNFEVGRELLLTIDTTVVSEFVVGKNYQISMEDASPELSDVHPFLVKSASIQTK